MKIKRVINNEEIEIELTSDEIANAHKEHVTNFMQSELENTFGYSPDVATKLAELAYEEYTKGNGLTEYECIEKITNTYDN